MNEYECCSQCGNEYQADYWRRGDSCCPECALTQTQTLKVSSTEKLTEMDAILPEFEPCNTFIGPMGTAIELQY